MKADVFLKKANGTIFKGRVWPGVAVFPDWFHSNTQKYWDDEFAGFFNADTGVDIDALWIDMNEPSNFCVYPCLDPEAGSAQDASGLNSRHITPESMTPKRRLNHDSKVARDASRKNTRRDQSSHLNEALRVAKRQYGGNKKGLPGRDLINPLYHIQNADKILSNKTADTDLIHQGGWAEYDTHNL